MIHEPSTVTVDAFLAEVRAMLEREPNATNPMRTDGYGFPMGCAYRAEVDGTVRRCVIGQYLHEHGYDTFDRHEGRSAYEVLRELGYSADVASIGSRIQTYADGPSVLDEHDEWVNVPRSWGAIAAVLDRLADRDDVDILAGEVSA